MLFVFLSVLYCLVCLFLVLVVLLQAGRGGGLGAVSGGSKTVFGGAGAGNVLTKATSVSAALFMILSATLAYVSSSSDKSLEAVAAKVQKSGPVSGESAVDADPADAAKGAADDARADANTEGETVPAADRDADGANSGTEALGKALQLDTAGLEPPSVDDSAAADAPDAPAAQE